MAGRGGSNVGCEAGEGGVSFFAPVTICLHSEWDTNPPTMKYSKIRHLLIRVKFYFLTVCALINDISVSVQSIRKYKYATILMFKINYIPCFHFMQLSSLLEKLEVGLRAICKGVS